MSPNGWPRRSGPSALSLVLVESCLVGGACRPAVEVVEDCLDGGAEFVDDLVLGLALAGALAGLVDDDLEDAGERDALEFCDLWCDFGCVADRGGEGSGLTV